MDQFDEELIDEFRKEQQDSGGPCSCEVNPEWLERDFPDEMVQALLELSPFPWNLLYNAPFSILDGAVHKWLPSSVPDPRIVPPSVTKYIVIPCHFTRERHTDQSVTYHLEHDLGSLGKISLHGLDDRLTEFHVDDPPPPCPRREPLTQDERDQWGEHASDF